MTRSLAPALLVAALTLGCGKDDLPTADTGINADDIGLVDMSSSDEGSNTEADARPAVDMADAVDTRDPAADMGATSDMSMAPDTQVSPDTSLSGVGCAAGFTEHEEVAGTVVACQGATDALNQCDAAAACGAGWHMCTATEYRLHFEATEPASVADASYWLASCIRDGGAPTSPTDLACADCNGTQTGATTEVSFSCVNAISLDSDQLFVGVRAGSACTFVGEAVAGNDAFWNAQPSSALQAGAFCCVD